MTGVCVAVIVEGHGEVEAMPVLLRRLFEQFWPAYRVKVLRPIRQPRDRLLRNIDDCLRRSLSLAAAQLREQQAEHDLSGILVLCDADEECARDLAVSMRQVADAFSANMSIPVSTVLAVHAYETWFAGASESLDRFLKLAPEDIRDDPEVTGSGKSRIRKSWIEARFKGAKYSETVDQAKMTAAMDLSLCRRRCPSMDKLCRDIERWLAPNLGYNP